METIAITGANGFVGTHFINYFKSFGYEILKITREDLHNSDLLHEKIQKADIVINLAGANIVHKWDEAYKQEMFSSRIETTRKLVAAINGVDHDVRVFISTSAVGIYDNKSIYTEYDKNYANDFLSNLCQVWEREAKKAMTRVVVFRFGIVLGKDGGALSKMLLPFKLGVGGTIGNGKQAFSFIHIDDLKEAFKFAINNSSLQDTYNLCATIPTTNLGLTKALGNTLNRPTIFPVPQFILNYLFGEGAKVLTDGQKAIPKRLEEAGFKFQYRSIEEAIENLLGDN